jgi:hypothetical protein
MSAFAPSRKSTFVDGGPTGTNTADVLAALADRTLMALLPAEAQAARASYHAERLAFWRRELATREES